MMNEEERQYCLEQMGIQTWFPRYRLPAAAPSVLELRTEPVQLFDRKSGIPAEHSIRRGSEEKEGRAEAVARQLEAEPSFTSTGVSTGINSAEGDRSHSGQTTRENSVGQKNTQRVEDKTDISNQPGTPRERGEREKQHEQGEQYKMVRCKLALSLLPGNTLVLNQLPAAGNGQLPVPHQQLLARIARYLDGAGSEPRIESIHPFRWPLLDLPDVDNSMKALRSALLAFLEGHSDRRISTLVLMGSMLTEQVFPPEKDDSQQRQGLQSLSCRILATYSLDQLIKMPELKKECWLALRRPAQA